MADTIGQQQIIKILPNGTNQQLKVAKHGTRSTDTPKAVTQVIYHDKRIDACINLQFENCLSSIG